MCKNRNAVFEAIGLALGLSSGVAPVSAANVELSALGTRGFQINGSAANDRSGYSVSGAGDVNGDGLADVIVGAVAASPNSQTRAGESYVVFGKSNSSAVELSSLGNGGFSVRGAQAYDLSGGRVAAAGDVNGDGLADLIIGANFADPSGKENAGESYIVFGKADSAAVNLSDLGARGFKIFGIDMDDWSGTSVAGAGDVNGDGLYDLIIGARYADPNGTTDAGETYIVFGKTNASHVELSSLGAGGFQINGIDMSDVSGGNVSGAGDVNGDGLDDVILGAQYADPNGSASGESYVVFGKTNSATVELSSLGAMGFRINGVDAGDFSGRNVSGAGDVNGDGLGDLVVGAIAADIDGALSTGEAYVVFGKTDSAEVMLSDLGNGGFSIFGVDSGDQFGRGVSSAGDVNGDGLSDMIIGAFRADNHAGESYVVFGKSDSADISLSTLGADGFRVSGSDAFDFSGRTVSGAGDVNGDGLADLLVGALGADPDGKSYAGESYVIFSNETPTTETPTYRTTSPAGSQRFSDGNFRGYAIGIAGDAINNDTPDSRAWIKFDNGSASTQTVTLRRDDSVISGGSFNDSNTAESFWSVSTNRSGWALAQITFHYTDAEIAGLTESELTLYKADDATAPDPGWIELATTVDMNRNTVSATVSSFSDFVIGSGGGLPVTLESFSVE